MGKFLQQRCHCTEPLVNPCWPAYLFHGVDVCINSKQACFQKRKGKRVVKFTTRFPLWRRPESNRCPNIFPESFLHVYFVISCRQRTGNEHTNPLLSWMVLSNQHSLWLQHSVLFLSRRRGMVTEQPARRP